MVSTSASVKSRGGNTVLLGSGVLLGAVAVVAVVGYLGDRTYLAAGIPFPGSAAALTYALLRLAAAAAGSLTLGSLVYTLFCTPPTDKWRVDVDGYAGVRVAERAATVWALAALALIPVSAADGAGATVGDMMRHGALGELISAGERPKAWIVTAALALLLAVALRFVLAWAGLFGLAAVAVVAVVAPPCVGNAGEGPNHDYATGSVILFTAALSVVGGLTWCLAEHARRGGETFAAALARYRVILLLAVAVMVPTAVILTAILVGPHHFGGVYGWLGVGGATLLAGYGGLAWWLPRARPAAVGPALTGAALAALVWLAVSVAMAIQPAPAFTGRYTAQQVFLGFNLPHGPNVWRLLTYWRFDVVLGTAAIVLGVLYTLGALRLRGRGDDWSALRTTSWLAGCVGLLLVTSSGVGTYGYAMFSVHMVIHMALNMFIPVLLVLGAPVTLLLRALQPAGKGAMPGPREWVLTLMHSTFTRVLSNAIVALAVFVVSLYGLYFSPLFGHLIRFHWGHLLMNIHFLLTGYLYYWAIIGVDPGPKRLPHIGRLGMLFAVMPFHAFFGVAVMSMDGLIGRQFYPYLSLGWLTNLMSDQRLGGELAWISGEIPVLLVVGALLSQWARQDTKVAVRKDRAQDKTYTDDDELAAYNAMLAELSRNRQ
jgi:putative copper resistance protein D